MSKNAERRTEDNARGVLRDMLILATSTRIWTGAIQGVAEHKDEPSVLLVVGVNGTGEDHDHWQAGEGLVADGQHVDTVGGCGRLPHHRGQPVGIRPTRSGAEVVQGPEGADPSMVAFDAVDTEINDRRRRGRDEHRRAVPRTKTA